jgi:hypothetical protein
MIKDKMVYGLLDSLGVNSDDSMIYPSHALMYLDMARNRVIHEYLKENGQSLPPGVLTTVKCEKIEHDGCNYFIDLTVPILDLPNDIGFYTLNIAGSDIPKQESEGRAKLTQQTRFADKTYCYRVGDRIILVGKYNLALSAKITFVPATTEHLDGEDNWPIPDSYAPMIWEMAAKMLMGNVKNPNDLNSDSKAETHG